MGRASRAKVRIAASVALLAAVGVAYARALDATFQFDDLLTVRRNARLADLGVFVREHLPAGWTRAARGVTDLTFAIDYAIAGWDSRQFHLTNVVVHLATVAVVLGFTLRILRRAGTPRPFPLALAVAALWGLHPIHTEAVTYVCQRAEVLAAFFTVLSLWLLLEAEERWPSRRGVLAYAAALLAFAAGVGSKTTAVVVPGLYLLSAICFRNGDARAAPARRVVLLAAPLVAAVAVGGIVVLTSLRGNPEVGFDVRGVTATRYLLTQLRVVLLYLRLLFWPAGQTLEWDVRPSTGLDAATLAAGVLVLALLGGAAWLLARARSSEADAARAARLAAFGIGWYFCALAPTSSVVPVVDLAFEHRAYLASWGIVLAVGAVVRLGVERAGRAWTGRAALLAGGLAAVALAATTHARNAVWQTHESLWRDTVEKSPARPRPHLNLGQALWERGDAAAALREIRLGLSLDDGTNLHPRHLALAYMNMSAALGGMGRHGDALEAAMNGIRVTPRDPLMMNNLAAAYGALGDHDRARHWAEQAVSLAPGEAQPHLTLGQELIAAGDVSGGVREIRAAFAADPESADAVIAMAILSEEGLGGKPCEWWAQALRVARVPAQRANATSRYRALRCAGQ